MALCASSMLNNLEKLSNLLIWITWTATTPAVTPRAISILSDTSLCRASRHPAWWRAPCSPSPTSDPHPGDGSVQHDSGTYPTVPNSVADLKGKCEIVYDYLTLTNHLHWILHSMPGFAALHPRHASHPPGTGCPLCWGGCRTWGQRRYRVSHSFIKSWGKNWYLLQGLQ